MLGYRYSLLGVVVAGNKLGRTMGFPTANMELYEPLKIVPANGVYAVEVEVLGQRHGGICNIGTRPTVGSGNARTIETNIFDFNDDIYGLDLSCGTSWRPTAGRLRYILVNRFFSYLGPLSPCTMVSTAAPIDSNALIVNIFRQTADLCASFVDAEKISA